MALNDLFNHRYYTDEFMDGLKTYKYSSIDTSPLAKYVMKPWWSTFLHYFVPLNVSANSMTFWGFMIGLSHIVLLTIYDPDVSLCQPSAENVVPPSWVWLYGALAHFLAHTLDGADGMQARRTGTSSPLGELMDHGLDSLSLSCIVLSVPSVFALQAGVHNDINQLFLLYVITLFGFYFSHWEKYITGVLFLPWTYDASMLLTQGIFLLAFFTQDGLFRFIQSMTGWTCAGVFLAISSFSVLFFSIPCTFVNIYRAMQDKNNKTVKKQATLSNGYQPLVPFFLSLVLFVGWHLMSNDAVALRHTRLFFYSWSLLFSNFTVRLIVVQMCSRQFSPFNSLLLLPFAAFLVDVFDLADLSVTMWCLFVSLLLLHCHYFICLIRQVAHHLGVPCLAMAKKRA